MPRGDPVGGAMTRMRILIKILVVIFGVLAGAAGPARAAFDKALPLPEPGGMAFFLGSWYPTDLNSQLVMGAMTIERDRITYSEDQPTDFHKVIYEGNRFVVLFQQVNQTGDPELFPTQFFFVTLSIVDRGLGNLLRYSYCTPFKKMSKELEAYVTSNFGDTRTINIRRGEGFFAKEPEELLEFLRNNKVCGSEAWEVFDDGEPFPLGTDGRLFFEAVDPTYYERWPEMKP